MARPKIVAGIPAYNEEKYVGRVVAEARKYVDVVLVVDDGSTDRTSEEAAKAGATVIRHPANMGYGAALKTIFKEARRLNADILVTLDADGQHDPKEIPRLVKPILQGEADLVVGSRFRGATEQPGWRLGGVKIITWAARIGLGLPPSMTDAQSGFRAYSKKAIKAIDPTDTDMGASIDILYQAVKNHLKIIEAPVTIKYHKEASSQNPFLHGFKVLFKVAKLSLRYRLLDKF